jgi:hypothetical protein
MRYRTTWFALALLALPSAAFAQRAEPPVPATCTEDSPAARRHLAAVLTDPDLDDVLAGAGVADVDPDAVVVLTHPRNARACARLQRRVPRPYDTRGPEPQWIATYYRAGDRYLVTVTLAPGADLSRPMPAWEQVLIVGPDFELLETILN